VWHAWGDTARYVPRGHEDSFNPRRYDGQVVAFVDIAPPAEAFCELAEVAARIIVLDHHVSARDRFRADPDLASAVAGSGHHVHFDIDHSGAILAWTYFHPDEPTPELLLYVEDQDLWSWKLPRSEEVNAAITSYPREFGAWENLAARATQDLAAEGTHIVRANRIEVERSLQTAHPIALGGKRAEAVNARHQRAPLGHELAKRATYGEPWGVVYRVSGDRVDVSIYSIGDLDVSEVAQRYGGGGHRNASGFSVPLRVWLDKFV
jgi:oligoribonuclease NrnB/cAMP/cGMP phosphodiesterase (DHH superfamily)